MVRFHGVCLYFFLLAGIGPGALITLQRYTFVFIQPKLLPIYFCNHYNFYIYYHLVSPAPILGERKHEKKQGPDGTLPCRPLLAPIYRTQQYFLCIGAFAAFPKLRPAANRLFPGRTLRAVVVVNNFSLAVHQADADSVLRHGEHGKSSFARAEAGTGHRFDGAGQRA